MASRTHNSSSSGSVRKGQFFILTAVAIVTILFFISRWVGPSTQVDTSSVVASEEFSAFDNIKEKSNTVVKNSENCDDLAYNIQEYKSFVENFARDKNYKIDFAYFIAPCSEELGVVVEFSLRIISARVDAKGTFGETWNP